MCYRPKLPAEEHARARHPPNSKNKARSGRWPDRVISPVRQSGATQCDVDLDTGSGHRWRPLWRGSGGSRSRTTGAGGRCSRQAPMQLAPRVDEHPQRKEGMAVAQWSSGSVVHVARRGRAPLAHWTALSRSSPRLCRERVHRRRTATRPAPRRARTCGRCGCRCHPRRRGRSTG
jgi:hypothetical protein